MDKPLASLFRFLTEALEEELESYSRLLDFINEETQALRHSRLPEILACGRRKSAAFWQSEAATQRRSEATVKIIVYFGLEDSTSFTELIAAADPQTQQKLTAYKEKFADLIRKIKSVNEINSQIIELTLTHVNRNIRFIRNMTAPFNNYDQHGQVRSENVSRGITSQV